MFGWRAKLGLIVPANNTVAEPELSPCLPAGVSLHATKMVRRGDTLAQRVDTMAAGLPDACEALHDSRVHAMAYGCMISCLLKGSDWTRETSEALGSAAVPFQTAAGALFTALRHLAAKKVAVFSPYPETAAAMIPSYFATWGLEVVANVCRSALEDPHVVVGTHPEHLFRDLAGMPRADALCILATDLPTLAVLEPLERTWGGPVVTSNQSLLWWLLRAAGVRDPLPGLGVLGCQANAGGNG
jgi:arylmalonate decarboxylase